MQCRIVVFLLMVCTACTDLKPLPDLSIYEAINKAGYQRMLTQRLVRCYISIVAGLDVERNKVHLQASAQMFEDNFLALKEYAPTEKVKDQFLYIEILWREYKFIYQNVFTLENAAMILESNNKILEASNEAVQLLEEYAVEKKLYEINTLKPVDSELARIINLSGRQRMLTQRIALYALAKACNFGDQERNELDYKRTTAEFTAVYKELLTCPRNTLEIEQEYELISKQWKALEIKWKEILSTSSSAVVRREELSTIIEETDLLMFSLDKVVSLYEDQNR